ncbi:MAG: DUF5131 family protein, partial [Bacillota bacterium]
VLSDQCIAAGVHFYFKSWGEYLPWEYDVQPPFLKSQAGHFVDGHQVNIIDPFTGDFSKEWYDTFEFISEGLPDCNFQKVGPKKSGFRLDGLIYRSFPEVK